MDNPYKTHTSAENSITSAGTENHELSLNDTDRYLLKYALDQAPMGVCINLIGSALFAAWQWSNIPEFIIIPWLIFIATNSLIHFSMINQNKKFLPHASPKKNWAVYNGFLYSMCALAWGFGFHFFLPYLDSGQSFFLYYISGIYLLSFIPVLAPIYNAYLCLVISLAVPVSFLMLDNELSKSVFMLALLLSTSIALLFIAKRYQKTIIQSYSLALDVKTQAEEAYQNQLKNFNLQFKEESDRHQSETEKILAEKDYMVKTLKSMGEAIVTTDSLGKITYVNPIAEIYLGWEKNIIEGQHIELVFNLYDEASKEKMPCPFEKCINSSSNISSTNKAILVRRDKIKYAIDYCMSPIFDKSSKITGTVLIFRDVTEKRSEEKTLSWQASHDQLTGLINRREFENRLNRILKAKDQHRQHALCYIDLDHFKIVNDCCGHLAGDQLLIKISERLKSKTRDTDTLARLGGDEFGLILYSCSVERAKLLAEIVRKEVENLEFEWQDKSYKVSASIGVVSISSEFDDLNDIIRSADMACYDAKAKGRNKVNIMELNQKSLDEGRSQTEWIDTVRDCLNRESFLLYQQSILSLDEYNNSSLCELLIRAKKDNNDLVHPDQFLPIARQYHLMPAIDKWVVKACFELLDYKHPSLKNFSLFSINISEQSICDESFLQHLIDKKNDYSIDASSISLEVPEHALTNHYEQTIQFIKSIKNHGFKVSIDDFNSGLENFKKIRDLDIDYIKFDGRIINNKKNIEYVILESMNDICHHMGSQTIAKYIDNEKNLEALYEVGVDYAQGYQFARPLQISKDVVSIEKALKSS